MSERIIAPAVFHSYFAATVTRFALSIAIVAKCDKKLTVTQDFFIWQKFVAKNFYQVI